MARPTIEIKKEYFENLCQIQCTLDEIAGFFKCSPDTIENWCKREYGTRFSDTYKKYSQSGKISLRRYQLKLAEKNASMAIWLGKQWLGQREDIETYEAERVQETIDNLQDFEIKFVDGGRNENDKKG